ncbi:glucose-6-phosphate 1-dehydrogenase [Kineosphaera limosa]|uniref:Glucose-6-phosphate 1-dehydrogenase n=1 Tax=Kineosphaera limosa NBRC 100340 TaxID=1184609 RepID=K6WUZ3_9MICO|nr:glucose-6-phosphate dehydrogenase [Kineosphaera limosa]NYE00223.1 glucose-6-phosphate 1-dehydrogenase [Kineosphaera limosa]GAB97666.1 glucose-6-phosphate 1-dehydrogenase [Kineosphaera limosa NBRC 100340]
MAKEAAHTKADEPVTLVIFGASGDLTQRLLLPGLGTLLKAEPHRRVTLVGAAVDEFDEARWHDLVLDRLREGGARTADARRVASGSRYERIDLLKDVELGRFVESLGTGQVVLYFALPPAVTAKICVLLASMDVPATFRLGLEKPFGTDSASAARLNQVLYRFAAEEQIFRIDHFLGKGAVLNLLGFRFANRIFEPVWNATNIERVEIAFDETLALEGRAGYYDKAGALADMIQSHLLLVCALVAMEDPAAIDDHEFRDLLTHVLRAMRLWQDCPLKASRRARYTAGTIDGADIPNYVDEPGVDPERGTETLAEVTVAIRNSRWAGVPFTLRSGKAMARGCRRIVVTFRPVNHLPAGFEPQPPPANRLVIDMNPERLTLEIMTNGEGDHFELERTSLSADIGPSTLRPYGEILGHIMDGNPILSVRGDMAQECWRIVTPVVEAWRAGEVPLEEYPAGSLGPESWLE